MAAKPKPWDHLALAVAVALLCFARHYAWTWLDPEQWWTAWKALSAVLVLGLVLVVWHHTRSRLMAVVLCWLAFEELQVGLCNTTYLFHPWIVPAGQTMCGSKFGFDIGASGLLAAFLVLSKLVHAFTDWLIHDRRKRY